MDRAPWDESKMATYNMVDAVSRSTVQVDLSIDLRN